MHPPDHAVLCWLAGDGIVVQYADHQQVVIPVNEIGRLANIMRCAYRPPIQRALRDLAWEKAAREHADMVRKAGEERRKEDEERKLRERKRLLRKGNARAEQKRLDEIANLIGI